MIKKRTLPRSKNKSKNKKSTYAENYGYVSNLLCKLS